MAFCGKCGAQADDGAKFCPSCGQPMEAAPEAPPQAPPAPVPPPQYQQPQVPPQYQQPPPGYQPPPQGYQPPPVAPPPPQSYQQPPQPGYQQPGYQRPPLSDADANKGMAVLSYLWLLLLIPLCTGKYKVSQFVKFHLNQGIIFSIFYTGYMIVERILRSAIRVPRTIMVWGIPVETYTTPGWLNTIIGLLYIPFAVLCILGIINAVKGETKPLPVIGDMFTVLK